MVEPIAIFEKEYYDRLKLIEGRHWWTLGMTDIMSRLLCPSDGEPPLTFLDIGCGSGIGLAWAAEHLPRARRIGIDVSEHALEHCRKLGAELVLASADSLPFPDSSIDWAICIDVLQHLPSDGRALSEVFRVLKPGGRFYVRTNARSFARPPPGSRLYTVASLRQGLETAGLQIERCSRVNFVGSLFAEASLIRKGRSDGHGHGHEKADEGPFKGGGYGGGLRITAEQGTSMLSRFKRALLRGEGQLIAHGAHLPFGHSIVALAKKG